MSNPLIAFALVAEEYEKSGDPIMGLAPLFRPILAQRAGAPFDTAWFAHEFSAYYGLLMTDFVARALRERMEELRLIRRTDPKSDSFVIIVDAASATHAGQVTELKIGETVETFRRWASAEASRLGRQLSSAQIEDELLTRLARPEFSSIFLDDLTNRSDGRIMRLMGRVAVDVDAKPEPLFDYLVARFLLTARDSAPEVFQALASIAFGAIIADAVSGLAVSGEKEMPEPPLRVIVDGPLILDYFGLNTAAHQEYAEGLFTLMRDAGLRLATFDHVVDEVRESILSALRAYASGTEYGPLGERLRQNRGYSAYATTIADTLDEKLQSIDMFVLRGDVYDRADFVKYFTEAQFDSMRNAIGDVHHQIERRLRDTKSVSCVVRLKKENRKPSSIFKAGTVFLTRNSALYRKVNYVLALGRSEPDPRFTIVKDNQLAGVLWFSLGGLRGNAADLSRRRLIANCASAIVPQREVVQRISDFLSHIDPTLSDEFATLMRDKRASLCPMRVTGGLIDQVNSESAFRVLEGMRAEIALPIETQAIEKQEAARAEIMNLEGRLSESREGVVVLQKAISAQGNSYDEQLAQLSLDLEQARSSRSQTSNELGRLRDKLAVEVDVKSQEIRKGRERAIFVIKAIWAAISVCAIWVSMYVPRDKSLWLSVGVFLICVLGLAQFTSVLDRLISQCAGVMFVERERKIAELKRQIGDLSGIILNSESK